MKNNKKILFLLLPLMVLIWGLIIRQVLTAISPEEPTTAVLGKPLKVPDQEVEREHFDLLLSYKDPFQTSRVSKYATGTESGETFLGAQAVKNNQENKKETIAWPQLRYGGMVKSSSPKEVGLLVINGKSYLIKKGGEYAGVKVLNYNGEEAVLRFSGEEKTVQK
jgi:hypothetical protein